MSDFSINVAVNEPEKGTLMAMHNYISGMKSARASNNRFVHPMPLLLAVVSLLKQPRFEAPSKTVEEVT